MTQQQQEHVFALVKQFGAAGYRKYARGCEEHAKEGNGNLWDLPDEVLIENLMEEILDLWMYAATLRQKIRRKAAAPEDIAV